MFWHVDDALAQQFPQHTAQESCFALCPALPAAFAAATGPVVGQGHLWMMCVCVCVAGCFRRGGILWV